MSKAHSIVGFGNQRVASDFYPTPRETTLALLNREKFEGNVWECAVGDGSMAKVIVEFNRICYCSDIRNDEDIYGEKGIDFLKSNKQFDNIITNPPYNLAQKFIEHALKCANKKVAMLLKLVFLEGVTRYDLFKSTPLKKVYVFCKRQNIRAKSYKGDNSSMIAYAWFIWDKSFKGEPTIDWIKDIEVQKPLAINKKEDYGLPPTTKAVIRPTIL